MAVKFSHLTIENSTLVLPNNSIYISEALKVIQLIALNSKLFFLTFSDIKKTIVKEEDFKIDPTLNPEYSPTFKLIIPNILNTIKRDPSVPTQALNVNNSHEEPTLHEKIYIADVSKYQKTKNLDYAANSSTDHLPQSKKPNIYKIHIELLPPDLGKKEKLSFVSDSKEFLEKNPIPPSPHRVSDFSDTLLFSGSKPLSKADTSTPFKTSETFGRGINFPDKVGNFNQTNNHLELDDDDFYASSLPVQISHQISGNYNPLRFGLSGRLNPDGLEIPDSTNGTKIVKGLDDSNYRFVSSSERRDSEKYEDSSSDESDGPFKRSNTFIPPHILSQQLRSKDPDSIYGSKPPNYTAARPGRF
ncbi:hypothetical protein AYI68_g5299 [Smittium mucronatum]|uniref:Uncharacterized protein n=1 Tax=Smittium mucronatum TaxID=133383 RepID=A0A1R0GUQ5_9FUNG|nr:hypothetical protein AYI68_g5299 [Smittium mucronatum]